MFQVQHRRGVISSSCPGNRFFPELIPSQWQTCSDSISLNQLLEVADMKPEDLVNSPMFTERLTYGHIRGSPTLRENIGRLYDKNLVEIGVEDVVVTVGCHLVSDLHSGLSRYTYNECNHLISKARLPPISSSSFLCADLGPTSFVSIRLISSFSRRLCPSALH